MMLEDLRELYQEVILDHGRKPRNFRRIENADRTAHGNNPICGDALVLYLALDGSGRIRDLAFQGKGCAISMASASMMTEIVKGLTKADAERLFRRFHDMCTKDAAPAAGGDGDAEAVERLKALAGVREFPIRVKCATLAWHTLQAALSGETATSTE
jgi:nitrogen fixation NifU-like protein